MSVLANLGNTSPPHDTKDSLISNRISTQTQSGLRPCMQMWPSDGEVYLDLIIGRSFKNFLIATNTWRQLVTPKSNLAVFSLWVFLVQFSGARRQVSRSGQVIWYHTPAAAFGFFNSRLKWNYMHFWSCFEYPQSGCTLWTSTAL